MAQLPILLILCFLCVVVVAAAFWWLIQKHNREHKSLQRVHRSSDQLSLLAAARGRMLPYPMPGRWMAIRSANTAYLKQFLGLTRLAPWSEALERSRDRRLFLSPPVNGWSLLIGSALPDPVQDVDAVFRCLQRVSAEFGEVQFFAADRVLSFHTWARFRNGRALRAYSCVDEVIWNEGWITLEERLLGLKCRNYGDELPSLAYDETSPEQRNTTRVPILASRWGIDFTLASELLMAQEEMEASGEDPSTDEGRR